MKTNTETNTRPGKKEETTYEIKVSDSFMGLAEPYFADIRHTYQMWIDQGRPSLETFVDHNGQNLTSEVQGSHIDRLVQESNGYVFDETGSVIELRQVPKSRENVIRVTFAELQWLQAEAEYRLQTVREMMADDGDNSGDYLGWLSAARALLRNTSKIIDAAENGE